MRRFSLYKRQKIYYVQFFNSETKKYLSGKSTGKIIRDEALLVVNEWLQNGVPDVLTFGVKAGEPFTQHLLKARAGGIS